MYLPKPVFVTESKVTLQNGAFKFDIPNPETTAGTSVNAIGNVDAGPVA